MRARTPRFPYCSYLLRLWPASGESAAEWRASLEEVGSGERVGFASLEALVEYLKAIVAGSGESRRSPNGAGCHHRARRNE